MKPITIDGTEITGATIDGEEVQEITIDGEVVWVAYVFAVYSANGDNVVKMDSDLNQVWEYTENTDAVSGVAADTDGYVYTSCADGFVHKITPGGSKVWEYDRGDAVYDIGVDGNFNVISVAITYADDLEVLKLDSDGNFVWDSEDIGTTYGSANAVYVRSDGYIFVGDSADQVTKFDPDGNKEWEFTDMPGEITDIVQDRINYVIAVTQNGGAKKFRGSDGSFSYEYDVFDDYDTDFIRGVAVDSDQNVYFAISDYLLKTEGGEKVWEKDFNGVFGIAVDHDDFVYATTGDYFKKLDPSDGSELAEGPFSISGMSPLPNHVRVAVKPKK